MIIHLILVRFLLSSHLYVNDRNNIDINAFLLIWLRHNFTFYLFFVVQLMISGSVDGFDVDDLRSHTNYSGGYHRVSSSGFISDHILSTFWLCISCLEILRSEIWLSIPTVIAMYIFFASGWFCNLVLMHSPILWSYPCNSILVLSRGGATYKS